MMEKRNLQQTLHLLVLALSFHSHAAEAIYSQPTALANSGPVQVNVDIEISEAAKLLPKATVKARIEERLFAAGIAVVREGEEVPSVVTKSEREPAQLWVNVAARRIADPAGYIISLEVSHLQRVFLHRVETIPMEGLDWHESWAQLVPEDADLPGATGRQLDSLVDDFTRDYQEANMRSQSQ